MLQLSFAWLCISCLCNHEADILLPDFFYSASCLQNSSRLLTKAVCSSFVSVASIRFWERNIGFCAAGGHLCYFLILALVCSVAMNAFLGVHVHRFVEHILRRGACCWVGGDKYLQCE